VRILIVEDDPRIRQSLADDLRRQNHAVDIASDGLVGLDFARTQVHDVILLDIVLPGLDGVEVCRRLRAESSTALILMITARDATSYKVGALDGGADDYLVKPFELDELSARIRALSRRPRTLQRPVLEHGGLQLDPGRATASYEGKPVALTPTEFAILEALMRSPLQIFSRNMLRNKVTTFDDGSEHDSIKTHITNIRRKLRAAGSDRDPIENVYGTGYRLADLAP
jgi:DNA-binding response OmpR family regulator